MPQSTAKNSWKSNSRLKPIEAQTKSNSAVAKLKNRHLECDILSGTQEILKSKIRRRASFEWEIRGTKNEADDLKLMTENLPRFNGECIKVVTHDRPKPTIIFIRPESTTYESLTFPYPDEDSKKQSYPSISESKDNKIFSKETERRLKKLRATESYNNTAEKIIGTKVKEEDSILNTFNPSKFNERKVQSAKQSENRWKKLYENSNPSDLTIDRRQKLYRPFTTGSYNKIAEKQARTKSQLSVIINNRFPSDTFTSKRKTMLNENNENAINLQKKVKDFCEDIEHFKRQSSLDCENYQSSNEEILYDNNLEKLLRKLNVV